MTQRFPRWVPLVLLLALYAAFMATTNHRLTILDDEGTIIVVANTAVERTLQTFIHGQGQHEHPPLSDFLLHGWLVLTHHSFAWLRIFATLFYIAGLLVLARCGEILGNQRTAWAILLFGTLWPFGYFYARVTGWYCFCFLLVSLLLYTYSALMQKDSRNGSWPRWTAFLLVSVMLIWSNYFGIAILLLLLADMLILRLSFVRKQVGRLLLVCTLIVLSFLPLLPALFADVHSTAKPDALPISVVFAKICFMLYALLASVSVAPWFLPWGIPALLGTVCLYIALIVNKSSRLLAAQFMLLILALALANHLDLKRLIFLTPWLILSAGLCLSSSLRPSAVTALIATLLVFFIGWLGIATGWHPATSNFYEPWQAVAETTATEARHGAVIISDSSPYFFYLNYALGLGDVAAPSTYLGPGAYQSRGATVFKDSYPRPGLPCAPTVLAVSGVAPPKDTALFNSTLDELKRSCKLSEATGMTSDPAVDYKRRLDPSAPLVKMRIQVQRFDCSQTLQ